jgi:hypothetical protein
MSPVPQSTLLPQGLGIPMSDWQRTPTSVQDEFLSLLKPATQPGERCHVSWARLLKRVFAIDLERCPRCPLGAWRILAALSSRPLMRRLLRPLKLAADPRRS